MAGAFPAALAGSELAKLRGRAPERAAAGARRATPPATHTPASVRRCGPGRCTAPTTSPRAASRWRWPSAAWPAGLGATVTLPTAGSEADLFGEAPGRAFIVSGPEEALRAALPDARVIGRVGGDELELERRRGVRAGSQFPSFAPRVSGGLVKFA